MKKVLIVDDDYLVRMYLRQLIDWEKEGFDIIGDVCNGSEALMLMETQMPQLIITDLSMPVMDGIELIRTIKERQIPVRIVALSCHDEFEYVKEAMKLGADEYVLKNFMDANSLCKLLRSLKDSIEQSKEQQQKQHELQRLAEKGRDTLRQELFERLRQQSFSYEAQLRLIKDHGLTLPFYQCAALLLWTDDPSRLNVVRQVCHQFVRGKKAELIQGKEDTLCILKDLTGIASLADQRRAVRSLTDLLASTLKEYADSRPYMGVSDAVSGDGSLTTALRQADMALAHSFYGDCMCFFTSLPPLGDFLPKPAAELVRIFAHLPCDIITCSRLFREAIAAMRSERTNPAIVRGWIMRMDEMTALDKPLKSPVTLEECAERLSLYEEFWKKNVQDNALLSDNPGVVQAAAYIKRHFHEAISLNHVADEVGLNPAYLSYLFKQKTGVNFLEYLLSCRLEQAKHLLASSSSSIKDIALAVGFMDYRHFCKTFKKEIGKRPSDYRRQARGLSKN